MWPLAAAGHCLVDPMHVSAVGFAVGAADIGDRKVVIHRSGNGAWRVVDDSELTDLDRPLRSRAISMCVAVVIGVNLTGYTVTTLNVERELRWTGVWRQRRSVLRRCPKERI